MNHVNKIITAIEYINGVDMNRQHPDTFWIPSDEEKDALEVGDTVKIGVTSEEGGERFWVEILDINDHGIKVRVDNDVLTESINYNDTLFISKQYILDIFPKE